VKVREETEELIQEKAGSREEWFWAMENGMEYGYMYVHTT
jgi:hypothetical protein